jgi:hypothetical protein
MSTWFWYDHSSLVKQLSESNTSGAKGQNQATDDLFAKKEHCASLRSKVEDDAKSESFGQNIKAVYQVFYSPSLNTCLSATYSIYGGTPSDELLSIDDVLTGRNVWQQYLKPSVKFPAMSRILLKLAERSLPSMLLRDFQLFVKNSVMQLV